MTSPSPFARPPEPDDSKGSEGLQPPSRQHEPQPARAASEQARLDEMAQEFRSTRRAPVRRRAPWFIGAAVVSALVVFGALVLNERLTQPAAVAGPGEQAVAYLTKIAEADADGARAMAWEKVEGPLLTRAALEASRQEAPITDVRVVRVGADGPAGTDVVLGYRRGGKEVQGTFQMVHDTDRTWRVRRPSARVRVSPTPRMIPVLVADQPLKSNSYSYDVELFPGVHRLTTGARWLQFTEPRVVVDGVTGVAPVNATAAPAPGFEQRVKEVVAQRSDACLKSTELAPKGCPWARRANADQPVRPGSVRYSLLERRIEVGRLGQADAIVHGTARMKVRLTATVTVGGSSQRITEDFEVPGQFAADTLTEGPDLIWEN